ncbi:FtsH protease activity modulator HflK [Azospirillum melinis]
MSETQPIPPDGSWNGDQPRSDFLSLAMERMRQFAHRPGVTRRDVGLVAALFAGLWGASGIYKVQPDEQGVVLRFGRWVETSAPGLHYHLPYPMESVLLPKVTSVNQLQLTRTDGIVTAARPAARNQMLTGDENIVEADAAVFWQIKDAGAYLFKVFDPEGTLKVAAESAIRDVVSRHPIQAALSDKRQQIADLVKVELQSLLDSYQVGIFITQVQLQRVDPPYAVIDAFNDVQRARADQERARNEGEAYRNDILPRARGEAERIKQEAEAYKAQTINISEGEAKKFAAIHQSYKQAADVTAWRLYLDSVDEVLRKSTKVIIDSSGKGVSGVVPYMPLSEGKPATQAMSQEGAR